MKVSLVTVTFNSDQTLRDTIQSVFNQTYSDIEYIIIDGLSKDNTVDIIRKYEPQFQGRLKLYVIIHPEIFLLIVFGMVLCLLIPLSLLIGNILKNSDIIRLIII